MLGLLDFREKEGHILKSRAQRVQPKKIQLGAGRNNGKGEWPFGASANMARMSLLFQVSALDFFRFS